MHRPLKRVNYVFDTAVLKQVPPSEFYSLEAVKNNVLGSENVIIASLANNVEKVICLSIDKAVYQINAVGMSTAMMGKTMVAKSRYSRKTILVGTR